jgi:hypothetical protein
MTETQPHVPLCRGIWLLTAIATLSISLQLAGCGFIGYETFKTDAKNISEPLPHLENTKIAYSIYYPKPKYWREMYFALTKTLQTKFQILDNYSYSDDRDIFHLYAEISTESSAQPKEPPFFLSIIHLFSLSTIPITWSEKNFVTFTVVAPNGEIKTFTYSLSIRYYSWLPFVLFNPGFGGNLSKWFEYYQEDRVKMFDRIATRFMVDAAPFILSHDVPVRH